MTLLYVRQHQALLKEQGQGKKVKWAFFFLTFQCFLMPNLLAL